MYGLFRLAAWFIPWLPRRLRQMLGTVIGTLAWLVAAKARKQATRNMQQVLGLPAHPTRAERRRLRRIVRGMFCCNVRNHLSAFALPSLEKAAFLSRVHIHDKDILDTALARGHGVIVISGHFGPFNELIHWMTLNGYPTTVPVEKLKDKRVLDLMLKLRRSQGVNFISLGGSSPLRELFSALRHNQVVLITGDRLFEGQPYTEKLFFGAKARLPYGPVQLAQRTGAALVGAFGWEKTMKLTEGMFVPLALNLPEEQQKDPDCLMDHVVETLEAFIAEHPDQWIVFSPIWSDSA